MRCCGQEKRGSSLVIRTPRLRTPLDLRGRRNDRDMRPDSSVFHPWVKRATDGLNTGFLIVHFSSNALCSIARLLPHGRLKSWASAYLADMQQWSWTCSLVRLRVMLMVVASSILRPSALSSSAREPRRHKTFLWHALGRSSVVSRTGHKLDVIVLGRTPNHLLTHSDKKVICCSLPRMSIFLHHQALLL
jgi:hypothetical protein